MRSAIQKKAIAQLKGRLEFTFQVAPHPIDENAQILLKKFEKSDGQHQGRIVPLGKVFKVEQGKGQELFDSLSRVHKPEGRQVKRGKNEMYVIEEYKAKQKAIILAALKKSESGKK
jgi:hypothetical protein